MSRVYLSLGTNLEERSENLRRALELLDESAVRVLRRSAVYETAPRDFLEQPSFLNMVAECETELAPIELLRRVLGIELEMGRDRSGAVLKGGPRIIDIDILLFGDSTIETEELTVPHPRMLERQFVLVPLLELTTEVRDPRTGVLIREFLDSVGGQGVVRVSA